MHSTAETISIPFGTLFPLSAEIRKTVSVMPINPIENVLVDQKSRIKQLISDRVPIEHRQEVMDALRDYERIIEFLGKASTEYADHDRAIDAIRAFFTVHRRPATEEQIVETLRAGGFRKAPGQITAAINVHINAPEKIRKNYPLKKVNGKVGLESWPDVMF